jgi:predicted solute-binding protein
MSAEERARALMMRHHRLVKNRQQSMLGRSAAEVGMPAEDMDDYWGRIQGKPTHNNQMSYDRSRSAMS